MTDSPIKWAFGENKPHYTRFNTTSPHLPACIGHRHQPASQPLHHYTSAGWYGSGPPTQNTDCR